MDSVKLNKDGVAPIKAELDQLAALKDKKELYALLGDMQKKGIIAYNVLYVGADEMNSSMNAVQTYQTGLSMGEREYYLENDEATAKIRDAFVHMYRRCISWLVSTRLLPRKVWRW